MLLTVNEVQKRVKDLRQWQAQITVLQKRAAETHAWLNDVAKVIGPERASELIGDDLLTSRVSTSDDGLLPSEHLRRSPIEDEVKRFLQTQTKGATSRQIIGHLQRSSGSVYNALSRLVKRDEVRKIERGPYLLVASPQENSGSEEDTAVPSESSSSRVSPQVGRDADSRKTEVGRDRDASGSAPLTSTDYVGPDLAGVPPEVSPAQSSPTKSSPTFPFAGLDTVSPKVPPTWSLPTKSPFVGLDVVSPEVQVRPLDLTGED